MSLVPSLTSVHRVRAAVVACLALVAAVLAVLTASPPAQAAYPGGDGRIAFVRGGQIYTMTQQGNDITRLTDRGTNSYPTWSPDGQRISFVRELGGRTDVFVMNAWGHQKRNVTRSGDVTSAGASWSPDGTRLVFARGTLQTIRSTAPFGQPTELLGRSTGGTCEDDEAHPMFIDRFAAWSPDGATIAVFSHSDCEYDDRIDLYDVASGEQRLFDVSGADCCGYLRWTDLFWGPDGSFGYTERNTGEFGEDEDAPTRIVYAGFASVDGDFQAAPSPSGRFLALVNASSGANKIIRARADGSGRTVLTTGSQPDWQPRP